MKDRRRRFDPTTPRAAGRLGSVLVLGLSVALAALCLLVEDDAVDTDAGLIAAGGAAVVAVLAWVVPWHRLGRWSLYVLPLLTLGGLVGLDALTDLSRAEESLAFYPTAWFVVLTWIGLTQPRGMTLLSSPFVAASALAVALPDQSQIPVAAVAVVIPAGVVIGEAMAWALSGIRQGQTIERRREADIKALAGQVSVLRAGTTTLEQIADVLARLAHEVFHGEHVSVVLSGKDGTLVPASYGAKGSPPSPKVAALISDTVEAREVRLIGENGTTLLIIPLVGESEIGGAVVVRQPKTGDDPFTQQLAVLFAAQAGPALEQFRVIGKLSEDLRRDDKVGIGNSRHAEALVQSLTPGDAVVYIDLDNFGEVNKQFGHQAGDRFLREFSNLLSTSVRDSDLTARHGGDEFIFIARDAEFDALPVANRLLQAWRDSAPGRSFSAGIAIHDGNDLPTYTLYKADKASNRAKREGKNRVCLSPKGGWLGEEEDAAERAARSGTDGDDWPDDGGEAGGVREPRPPIPPAPPGFAAEGLPSALDPPAPPPPPAPKNLDFLSPEQVRDDRGW
jgi:diguanylate cyclase (GGDEF)-like protein